MAPASSSWNSIASSAQRNQLLFFLTESYRTLQTFVRACSACCLPSFSAPRLKLGEVKEPLEAIKHLKLSPLALKMMLFQLLVPSCLGAAMGQLERRERQPTGFSQVLPLNFFFWVEYPLILQNHTEPGVRSPLTEALGASLPRQSKRGVLQGAETSFLHPGSLPYHGPETGAGRRAPRFSGF